MGMSGERVKMEERLRVKKLKKDAYESGWQTGWLGAERTLKRVKVPFPTVSDLQDKFCEEKLLNERFTAKEIILVLNDIERGFKEATDAAFEGVGNKGGSRRKQLRGRIIAN